MDLRGKAFSPAEYDSELVAITALQYVQVLGLPPSDAQQMALDAVQAAHVASERNGTSNLPLDQGDRLLASQRSDDTVRAQLLWKRSEGVTDDDVRRWWNQPDVGRWLMRLEDDVKKYGDYRILRAQRGLSKEDALAELCRMFPRFDDAPSMNQRDRHPVAAIPWELKFRVNLYLMGCGSSEEVEKRRAGFLTMNDFVRSEIKHGRL